MNEGDVYELLDTPESRFYYGSTLETLGVGEHWRIERPWTLITGIRRVSDSKYETAFIDELQDPKIWRKIES